MKRKSSFYNWAELEFELLNAYGLQVEKISGKPFKSGGKICTVKGVVLSEYTNSLHFTFKEHDATVEIRRCKPVQKLSVA